MNDLKPSRKLPKALQWVNEKGELCDRVGHDLALFGSAFCLPPFGDKLHIPTDILRPGDINKKGVPLNDLIKRRRGKQEKTIDTIEAEEKEKRIQAFIANGMGESAEDGGIKDRAGLQYNHGETKVHLRGLAKMTNRYGQVFTEN